MGGEHSLQLAPGVAEHGPDILACGADDRGDLPGAHIAEAMQGEDLGTERRQFGDGRSDPVPCGFGEE
jgi:hypothetical protein